MNSALYIPEGSTHSRVLKSRRKQPVDRIYLDSGFTLDAEFLYARHQAVLDERLEAFC